jgi:hypothetical protein
MVILSGGVMGLKDWFAGKVAGPEVYGNTMGPQAREGGSALANMVFMSHGTHVVAGPPCIFESEAEMRGAGFTPRFAEIRNVDLQKTFGEELAIFKNLQAAMLSFTFILNSNSALQFMRRDNTSKFRNGFGASFLKSIVDYHLYENIEDARAEISSYIKSFETAGIRSVLDMEKPASGDLLEYFISRAIQGAGVRLRYGFNRTGPTGFDVMAIPLGEETVKSIAGAAKQYNW